MGLIAPNSPPHIRPLSIDPTSRAFPRMAELAGWAAVVFAVALALLAWQVRAIRVSAAYADAVAGVRAQDEATYVNSSMRMVADRDWLTPKLMGRLFLSKPPVLQWLTALSIQLFGLGLFSVRLPSLLAGAAGVAAVFAWTAWRGSWGAAVIAALLLVSDPIWVTFSRLCYTDVLASTFAILAMLALVVDPLLDRLSSRVCFGVAAGSAVMAKSVVGVLPIVALLLYAVVLDVIHRPGIRRVVQPMLIALVIAAPWHLYQMAVHGKWFWAEMFQQQLVSVGVTESTGESGLPLLYLRRLLEMDPVLCLLTAFALAGAIRAFRQRDAIAAVTLSWTIVVVCALAAFRGRSVSYLVLLIPVLCVLAARYPLRFLDRRWPVMVAVLVGAFGIRAAVDGHSWSMPYSVTPIPTDAGMRWYYRQSRDTELIVAEPDDGFYSMTLPLKRVRYAFVGAGTGLAPYFSYLGIAVTVDQFRQLPTLAPVFSQRLASWGVFSTEPIASTIVLSSADGIRALVHARPDADFNIPDGWESMLPPEMKGSYDTWPSAHRLFLLAHGVQRRPIWPLPPHW